MPEPKFRWPLKDNQYRVIDGDTVEVLIDKGFRDRKEVSIRLLGVDAPEAKTRKNLLERKAGKLVTRVVRKWMLDNLDPGGTIFVSSESKPKFAERTIGRIWIDSLEQGELSDFLLIEGFVRPYLGGKKEEWDKDLLDRIISKSVSYLCPSRETN